jgi:hypothetical protein
MKRLSIWAVVTAALMLSAGAATSFAQNTFKIPYPFKVGSASFPKGDYTITQKDDSHLTLKQISSGKETDVAFSKRAPQANHDAPEIVVDEVGDFAPSYTDYITVYVLSEVWLPGADGYILHEMKGAHKTDIVKGEK